MEFLILINVEISSFFFFLVFCFQHHRSQRTISHFSVLARIAWHFHISIVDSGFPIGRFSSLGYHWIASRVSQLSVNLTIMSFAPFCFRCSRKDISSMDLSISFCVVISRCFAFFVAEDVNPWNTSDLLIVVKICVRLATYFWISW